MSWTPERHQRLEELVARKMSASLIAEEFGDITLNAVLGRCSRTGLKLNPEQRKPIFNATKTHCPKGHEYSPKNTYICNRPDGGYKRYCKACAASRRLSQNQTSDTQKPACIDDSGPYLIELEAIRWDREIAAFARKWGTVNAAREFGLYHDTVKSVVSRYEARAA